MVHLILDTNIWIYLAEGQHPFVLEGIGQKIESGDINLLVNQEIIREWDRKKDENNEKIKRELNKHLRIAKDLANLMDRNDAAQYLKLIEKISKSHPQIIDNRFNEVDNLIKTKSINVPITKQKTKVVEWALNHKAPFHRMRNSVADALILFSSIDYIKENGINNVNYNRIDISDSIFVSYNSHDFSKEVKGSDKNIIHPDLKPLLESVGMKYERNFGNILNLSTEMRVEIDGYMDYVESKILEQFEWENEIAKGKIEINVPNKKKNVNV